MTQLQTGSPPAAYAQFSRTLDAQTDEIGKLRKQLIEATRRLQTTEAAHSRLQQTAQDLLSELEALKRDLPRRVTDHVIEIVAESRGRRR